MSTYDVIVIGGGPGGYVAAIRAAQLGLKAAVVEREHLGGICLNWGCIPTKALLRSAEVFHLATRSSAFGLRLAGTIEADIEAIVSRSRKISGKLNGGVGYLLEKNGVDVIWGEAKLTSAGEISVSAPAKTAVMPQHPPPKKVKGAGTYSAKHIIVATGARPRTLDGITPDGDRIWSYFDAMKPSRLPNTLVVMGSGAIGMEFASFYRSLGVSVTVIEVMDQVLPAEDAEIAGLGRKAFEKAGMRILTSAKVVKVETVPDGAPAQLKVHVERGDEAEVIQADHLISAVGVVGNIEGLGLAELGVELSGHTISTDGVGRTNVAGIYAIGDVAGPPMLAHKAEHEGVICVEAIAGQSVTGIDKDQVPGCTYCSPQIASVGLTEQTAKARGHSIKVGRFPFHANGKAVAMGEGDGLIKTIFDAKTGQLLGAHMIGAEVTELIQGFVVAMKLETTEHELMHGIFPHPTLSEMMHESVLDAYDRAIHILS